MIKTFAHKGLEDFFYEGTKRGIPPQYAQKMGDILDLLDSAGIVPTWTSLDQDFTN